ATALQQVLSQIQQQIHKGADKDAHIDVHKGTDEKKHKKAINGLAILNSPSGPILRLSYQADLPKNANKNHKYKGLNSEATVAYFDATTGHALSTFNDKDYAIWLAKTYRPDASKAQTNNNEIIAEQVRHFGMGYDFRNKRLPVWRVTLNDAQKSQLFIDTQSGVLADHNNASSRLESLSFSMLHKWGFLVPLTGRTQRDYIMVFFLGLAFVLTVFGLRLKLNGRKKVKR
ncbi:hypothetical protein, partial [Algibacillus agarilyticus]